MLKCSITAAFISGLWVVWKFTSWRFRYCWTVALTNSVLLSDCMLISFLFWNKNFKADVIQVAVLSFRGTLEADCENISNTFRRYFYLSLYFASELKYARSISQTSSIFVTVYGLRWNLFLQVCVKCTCSDLTTNFLLPFSYFYRTLLTLLLSRTLLDV